jgi:multimeric flavodoxin WrbA
MNWYNRFVTAAPAALKILGISTSTSDYEDETSKSKLTLKRVLSSFRGRGHEAKLIEAEKLHIVDNLGCYSHEGKGCADPKAGKYRCWAHHNSVENPDKYGGVDEMPEIYDGIEWADVVIFATPVRWMSHSSLLQRIIERMNTLENRKTVYGEEAPCAGKKAGVIVIGHNYKADQVCSHLAEVLGWFDFDVAGRLYWSAVDDIASEDTEKDRKRWEDFLSDGTQIRGFVDSFFGPERQKKSGGVRLKVLK